jgi:site-specific recombinase XerD
MAKKYLIKNRWYVKTKTETGKWKNVYIGTNKSKNNSGITATEAEHIRKIYDGKELNRKNDTVIRYIEENINNALSDFLMNDLLKGKSTINLSTSSKESYKNTIIFLKKWFVLKNIKTFNQITIELIDNFISDNNHLSSKTQSERQRILIRFLKWSDEKGYWSQSSKLTKIKRVKKQKAPPKFLSIDDLHKLFDNCNPKYRNAIKFMYLTGSRVSEIGFFKWSDYNQDIGSIRFDIHDGTKTKRVSELFICDQAKNIIEEQRTICSDFPYIFQSAKGKKIEGRYLANEIKNTFEKLNIDATSHILRHSFASQLAINGVSLMEIRDLLRHADISETQIYAHLCSDSQKNALKKLPV